MADCLSKIEEIKKRWAAATPGPWVDMPPVEDSGFLVYGPDPEGKPIAATTHVSDLLAITKAPEDIHWLVERVERLERGIKELALHVCYCHELHPDQYRCTFCVTADQLLCEKAGSQ